MTTTDTEQLSARAQRSSSTALATCGTSQSLRYASLVSVSLTCKVVRELSVKWIAIPSSLLLTLSAANLAARTEAHARSPLAKLTTVPRVSSSDASRRFTTRDACISTFPGACGDGGRGGA